MQHKFKQLRVTAILKQNNMQNLQAQIKQRCSNKWYAKNKWNPHERLYFNRGLQNHMLRAKQFSWTKPVNRLVSSKGNKWFCNNKKKKKIWPSTKSNISTSVHFELWYIKWKNHIISPVWYFSTWVRPPVAALFPVSVALHLLWLRQNFLYATVRPCIFILTH